MACNISQKHIIFGAFLKALNTLAESTCMQLTTSI